MGISEQLEAMAEALETLPERLAAVLAQPLPTLRSGDDLGGGDVLPSVSMPDVGSESAQPLAPTPSVRVVDWTPNAPPPPVRMLDEGPDPLLPGVTGNAFDPLPPPIGAPAGQGQPTGTGFDRVEALLEQILQALQQGDRGGTGAGVTPRPLSGGADYGTSNAPRDFESSESFPSASSPSVNASSLSGLRGAGGQGYGSRYQRRSLLSGGGVPGRFDFLEPRRGQGGENG